MAKDAVVDWLLINIGLFLVIGNQQVVSKKTDQQGR